ncbi:flagellar assembly protein FliW [Salibacterium halotolerans]|uniref:Flagellar assembly factor FliW n=1 Tax=Salibacterium halotolerans TaxID=1884432 RepID=A0A1I5WYL2_9BACI|nr:flagellar assembly protein FliW [Salibacterium halotolerans]SFQ24799.1 flagellar assembly factor FliW [Salibacterium halotolerans]
MNIQTKYFGEIRIEENSILRFEQGLPAFEDETAFVLLPFTSDEVFFILQSIHTPQLAFVMTDPFQFFDDYQVEVPDSVIEQLEIEEEKDVALFVMLTLEEPFSETTANLQAPILLNMKVQKGKQHILSESPYERKHFIFPQDSQAEEKGAR